MNGYQPTNRQVEEWKQRRARGEAYWRIAAEYDVTRQTVSKYVNGKYEILVGRVHIRPEPKWWNEARKLFADGLTRMEIAVKLNKDWSTIDNAVNEECRKNNLQRHRDYEKYKRKK